MKMFRKCEFRKKLKKNMSLQKAIQKFASRTIIIQTEMQKI